jgi:Arc/MetJ-type ribon-helix-helix transcriptional regulator
VKISVSLPDQDVEFLDDVAREGGGTRSAVLRRAIGLLRVSGMTDEYVEAYREWEESGDSGPWEAAVGDGLETDPPRGDLAR